MDLMVAGKIEHIERELIKNWNARGVGMITTPGAADLTHYL